MSSRLFAFLWIVGFCGCQNRKDSPPVLPIAVVDTATGEVVERWEAPPHAYDVAVDPPTGRVWITAESSTVVGPPGSEGARVWEVFGDRPPEPIHELPPVGGQFTVGKDYWLDTGNIAIDGVRRRGMFSSPASRSQVLLDLDTGSLVEFISGEYVFHSATFDTASGIGYGTSQNILFSFSAVDGVLLDQFCGGYGLAYSHANEKLYAAASVGSIIIYDPLLGTCTGQIPVEYPHPVADYCGLAGIAVNPNGSRLYLSCPGSTQPLGEDPPQPSFIVMDLTSGMGLVQTEVPDIAGPHGFEVSPDGTTLYVTEVRCNRVRVYDAATGIFKYDIAVDGETLGIDLSADGSRLFVVQAHPRSVLGGGDLFYRWDTDDGEIPLPPCPAVVAKTN